MTYLYVYIQKSCFIACQVSALIMRLLSGLFAAAVPKNDFFVIDDSNVRRNDNFVDRLPSRHALLTVFATV